MGRCDLLTSQAANAVSTSRDLLLGLFERIETIFKRLVIYIDVPQTSGMTDVIVKVMVEVLCILSIATKEISQHRASELIPGDIPALYLLLFRNISEEACGKDGYRGRATEARGSDVGGSPDGGG